MKKELKSYKQIGMKDTYERLNKIGDNISTILCVMLVLILIYLIF